MIKNFIYGKTPPAINREKFWRVDSIGKEVMQIKERGFTQTVLFA